MYLEITRVESVLIKRAKVGVTALASDGYVFWFTLIEALTRLLWQLYP